MTRNTMSGKLSGKVAIITGAGSGIGAASAKLLAREGAQLVVVDLDGLAAEKVVHQIKADGGLAIPIQLDVAINEGVQKLVEHVIDLWSQIDILVNNAAMAHVGLFIDSEESTWDRAIAVNLKGTMFFSKAVLQYMIERRYGKIINISSASGKLGSGMMAIYSATKAGICAFSKSLAREVAHYNINVNDICPGPTDTPLLDLLGPKLKKISLESTAFRRLGRPEEVASAVLFLASDDASFITGHSLMVDGGQTMI